MTKKKNSTRRILILIGVLVVLFAVIAAVGAKTGWFGSGGEGITVETAPVEIRDVTQVVTASGKVQPETEVKISPDVSGEIVFLGVKEGDEVSQGQLLVRIKPDFYVAQTEQASARVSQARAALSQARANLLQAELDVRRSKELFEKNVIAESEFETVKTQYDVAQANYESAEFGLASSQAAEREAREQLNKTRIYAPMSGTISQLNVEAGERVVGTSQMAGTELMRVARLNQMELEVDVNENDVVNIALGDSAAIEVDAYPERVFRGVVTEIANSARVTGAGTQEQVTNFPVKIRVLDDHNLDTGWTRDTPQVRDDEMAAARSAQAPRFRPGMSGTVDIFTATVSQVVAVPIQAVTVRDFNLVKKEDEAEPQDKSADEAEAAGVARTGGGRPRTEDLRKVVFLVVDDKAEMVEVQTGISDDSYIEVRSGLEDGQTVITGPYTAVSRLLQPESKVKTAGPGRGRTPGIAVQ